MYDPIEIDEASISRDRVCVIAWSTQQRWSHSDLSVDKDMFVDKDMVLLWSHHAVHYCC